MQDDDLRTIEAEVARLGSGASLSAKLLSDRLSWPHGRTERALAQFMTANPDVLRPAYFTLCGHCGMLSHVERAEVEEGGLIEAECHGCGRELWIEEDDVYVRFDIIRAPSAGPASPEGGGRAAAPVAPSHRRWRSVTSSPC
jgi:hypothetical protein